MEVKSMKKRKKDKSRTVNPNFSDFKKKLRGDTAMKDDGRLPRNKMSIGLQKSEDQRLLRAPKGGSGKTMERYAMKRNRQIRARRT
jgi:hypothetical protein